MAKIPEQAKKVFEGVIFDLYQWEQKMYDGSTMTFEMAKRPNTIEILATKGDKIILTDEEQPTKPLFRSLPAGKQEESETPLEAAKREFLEETGMVSDEWELFSQYDIAHKIDWEVYTYIARDCKKVADTNLESGEKITVVEATFDEFIECMLSDDNRYWATQLHLDILHMQRTEGKLEEFRKQIFGVK